MKTNNNLFKVLPLIAVVLSLAACEGDSGPMGARGATGTAGATGATGTSGANGVDAGTPPVAACTPGTLPSGLPGSAIALTASNKLVRFAPGSSAAGNQVTVLGLGSTETLLGIDFRPADGTLIGVTKTGTTGGLIRINPTTGEITRLALRGFGAGTTSFTLAGTLYGVDFNPAAGALRIVGDNEENYRLTFSGTNLLEYTVNLDTALTPAGTIVGAGYTNNFTGTPVTTIYDLDTTADSLLTQGAIDGGATAPANPNGGVLTTVGVLGVDFIGDADLDIDGVTGVALAVGNLTGAVSTGVYAIDLGTGVATCINTVPAKQGDLVVDLAIPTPNPAIAYGISGTGLFTFTPNAAGVAAATGPVAITGFVAGTEVIVGMDARPRTGALTVVTRDPSNATVNLGRVYELNPVTGALTLLAAASGTLDFDDGAVNFGVDFNPVPNALRIVTDTGQNIRLTFANGTGSYTVVTDGAITYNAATVGSMAVAYTNNFDPSTTTRLYSIEAGGTELHFRGTPNGPAAETLVGALGVTATNASFDIVGGSGVSAAGANIGNTVNFAALTVGGTTGLYRINLATGTASTAIGTLPAGVSNLTVVVRK